MSTFTDNWLKQHHIKCLTVERQAYPRLPREALFDVVDIRLSLSSAAHLAHVVAQATIAADQHAHSANLVLSFHSDKCVDVWSAREHLHSRRGALDFLGVAGSSDEEHDAQHFTAALHGQDTGHPGPDPLQVFR